MFKRGRCAVRSFVRQQRGSQHRKWAASVITGSDCGSGCVSTGPGVCFSPLARRRGAASSCLFPDPGSRDHPRRGGPFLVVCRIAQMSDLRRDACKPSRTRFLDKKAVGSRAPSQALGHSLACCVAGAQTSLSTAHQWTRRRHAYPMAPGNGPPRPGPPQGGNGPPMPGCPCQPGGGPPHCGPPRPAAGGCHTGGGCDQRGSTSCGQTELSDCNTRVLKSKLGKHRCSPCSAAGVAGARLYRTGASTPGSGRARKKSPSRTGGGKATTGCFPCSVFPWMPSCAHSVSAQRHAFSER